MELPPWLEQKLKSDWAKQQLILMNENMQRKFKRVKFTGMSCRTLPIIYCLFVLFFCWCLGFIQNLSDSLH